MRLDCVSLDGVRGIVDLVANRLLRHVDLNVIGGRLPRLVVANQSVPGNKPGDETVLMRSADAAMVDEDEHADPCLHHGLEMARVCLCNQGSFLFFVKL